MKRCDKMVREAFKYWEGMLTKQEQAEIAEHLKTCPNCEKRFAQARQIRQALHNLPKVKTSPHFNVVLHARLRREVNRKRGLLLPLPLSGWSWQVPAYAAAVIILITGGILIDQALRQETPGSSSSYRAAVSDEMSSIPFQQAGNTAPAKIKNYVMQPIPMEQLLEMNRRYAARQGQQSLERRPADTSRAGREYPTQRLSGIRQVSAPVQF